MAWTVAIDNTIETARHIERTVIFEVQNGHQAENVPATWSNFVVVWGGWGLSKTEGCPPADTLRCNVAMDHFLYFEEFNHANPLQKFAYCRLLMIIYLGTVTPGTGRLLFTENSRMVGGNGTTFTTELAAGSIVQVGEFRGYVRNVVDNTNLELFEVATDTVGMPGVLFDIVDDERQYIFRGLIEDGQQDNANYVIEAMNLLHKLKSAICVLDMEATQLQITGPAPSNYAVLRHAAHFDVGSGGEYTFEIDPGIAGQAGAEDIFGNNRSFVPNVFEVVDNSAVVPPGSGITASEYTVDCPYGLIRFHNDQTGSGLTYYIVEVFVYLEGTLELADIVEAMLQYNAECSGDPDDPGLGPGFLDAQLQIPLTGTFTLTNGAVFVGGVGTAFDTELEAGDRIALDALSDDKGIVASITFPDLLVLKYPFKGPTTGPGTGFKSSLKESEISVSNLRWWKCDGTCADLLRHLRDYYADSKGYRIWFDHLDNLIRGERVAISATDIIDLPPKTGLRITNTTENFASAIGMKGTLGRAKNLATDAGATVTGVAPLLPLVDPGANLWFPGAGTGEGTSESGMYWQLVDPGATLLVHDADITTAYMVYRNEENTDPDYPLETSWYQYLHIDLGADYDLEQISMYAPNCKNPNNYQYGISIHKSAAFAGAPVVDLGPLTPECYHRNIGPDEDISFDLTSAGKIRYILILMRPIKWVEDGGSRTMGLRELIIFGSVAMCEIACIQGVTCPGRLQAMAGTITFDAGGPPWMVTGVGTAFGGAVGTTPQVGDSICLNATVPLRLLFGYIEEIINATSLRLALQYPGIPGANGNFSRAMWPSLDNYPFGPLPPAPTEVVEGEGGHYIGGSIDFGDGITNGGDYIIDYYPTLLAKMHHTVHRFAMDDSGVVFTEAQAKDRAYLILNEMIRLYREIQWSGAFDPRVQLYDTVRTVDDYRASGNETLKFFVEAISLSDDSTAITGIEYGAGVLE